ncbi:MAG TPA: stage II sporulation protein M, partial [Cytophagaceae bacterium]|nr:stage II sporulation protein M [Cytophagaceae bacterium]
QDLETLLKEKQKDPDQLSELFIQVSEDLSYARTFYPNRSIRVYLNNITQAIFFNVYKNKRTQWKDIVFFWKEELPYVIYHSRKELSIALVIFSISMLFGIISSFKDPAFAERILGNAYVEMTNENIAGGDPMAVYKKMNQMDMFFGITLNNLRVAFLTYILGLFFSIGSISLLMYNGVMVATFQYFFYARHLFWESFLTIWLHGTIEISCIILAAGAGIRLGSGLLFPGTYTRLQAFRISGTNSLKLILGLAPLICLAAFIESFITRYTGTPDWLKALLIIASFLFIAGYFIVLPLRKAKKGFHPSLKPERLESSAPILFDRKKIYDNGYIFKLTFVLLKANFKKIIVPFTILSILYSASATYTLLSSQESNYYSNGWFFFDRLYNDYTPSSIKYANIVFFSFIFTITIERFMAFLKNGTSYLPDVKDYFLMFCWSIGCSALILSLTFLSATLFAWCVVLFVPFLWLILFVGFYEKNNIFSTLNQSLHLLNNAFLSLWGMFFILFITATIFLCILFSPLWYLYLQFLNWNILLSESNQTFLQTFIPCFMSVIALSFVTFFIMNGIFIKYFSMKEQSEANSLIEKIKHF